MRHSKAVRGNAGVLVGFFALLSCAAITHAAYVFTPLASTGDAVPDGGGATFSSLTWASGKANGAFSLYGSAGPATAVTLRGVYASAGPSSPLVRLADTTTSVPAGGGATFSGFSSYLAGGGATVAFAGYDPSGPAGIYSAPTSGGPLSVVADFSTPRPGGTGTFGFFGPMISAYGGTTAFSGGGAANADPAVYFADAGGLHRIVDNSTVVPGATTAVSVSTQMAGSGSNPAAPPDLVFGSGTNYFVRRGSDGRLAQALSLTTKAPGAPSNGTFTGTPTAFRVGDGAVTFTADVTTLHGQFHDGLYRYDIDTATLARVADITMAGPDGIGNFTDFGTSFAHGQSTLFNAYGSFINGFDNYLSVYLAGPGGDISSVLRTGDLLDGKQVYAAHLNDLIGDTAYVTVDWEGGGSTLYATQVPEPGAAAALATVAAASLLRRRNAARRPG